jgi:hypothetical protein
MGVVSGQHFDPCTILGCKPGISFPLDASDRFHSVSQAKDMLITRDRNGLVDIAAGETNVFMCKLLIT